MRVCSLLLAFVVACSPSVSGAARAERVSEAGEVVVILGESFLNALLVAAASQQEPPSFPLSKGDNANAKCQSRVQLLPEAAGVRTSLRFANGRVEAPVAFRGSYAAPLVGCLNFEGWAETSFALEFDRERQVLAARVTVRDLKLRRVPTSLIGGGLTGLVQDAIDARVNPVEILRAEQLGARVPVTRDSQLRLRARDVRHEIAGRELRLHVLYELVQP